MKISCNTSLINHFSRKLSILQYYAALASTIVIRAIIYLLIHPCSYSQARCSHISDNITLYHCRNDTFNFYFFPMDTFALIEWEKLNLKCHKSTMH